MRFAHDAILAVLVPAALAGCAATRPAPAPATSATVELHMERQLELSGSRGDLRTLRSELRVEFRPPGQRRGVDAGAVTLGGVSLDRHVAGRDANASIDYRLDQDALARLAPTGADGWADLSAAGSPGMPPVAVRVRLAPVLDIVTPVPGIAHPRTEPLVVRVAAPPSGVWTRLSLGDGAATAGERGAGLWEFTSSTLAGVPAGTTRLRVEVETSCDGCVAAPGLHVRWFGRTELDVAVTLL